MSNKNTKVSNKSTNNKSTNIYDLLPDELDELDELDVVVDVSWSTEESVQSSPINIINTGHSWASESGTPETQNKIEFDQEIENEICSEYNNVYVGVSPTVKISNLLTVPKGEQAPDQQSLNKMAQAILSIWVNVVKRKRCPLGEHGKMTGKYLYRTRCNYDKAGEECPNKDCAFYGRKETGHQTIHYPPCRNGPECEPTFNVIATIAQLLSDQPLSWRPQKLYGLCKGYHSYSEISRIIHDYLETAPDVVRKYNTALVDAITSRNIEKNCKATYQNYRPVSMVPSIIEKK